jgi:hypothetical protein
VSVLSAGSSAVAPYTESGARFPLEASQFEVIDQRPFEEILGEFTAAGVRFENYDSSQEPGLSRVGCAVARRWCEPRGREL